MPLGQLIGCLFVFFPGYTLLATTDPLSIPFCDPPPKASVSSPPPGINNDLSLNPLTPMSYENRISPNFKQTSDEKKEKYQLWDYQLIQ